ncbi:hypothetical protein [Actinoplanes sp. DH11]|uniref:hypothetical protein n=1 Tax=Actinoplanes sp. DH11 TaxID=2857011 RepID=UPI001E5E3BFE|nr:hypothetical protein [Actinoplanes sp. DH11]
MRDGAVASGSTVPAVVPMRPMTAGELLDAGAALLRQRALPLFALAAPLAAGEQLILARLRDGAGVSAPTYLPDFGNLSGWWAVAAIGFGLETVILVLLGGYAGAAAAPALLGRHVRHRTLWSRTRPLPLAALAAVAGVLAAVAAYCGFVPWLILYGLIGLAAPLLTLNRAPGPIAALGRSVRVSARSGLRPALIRLLGYATWFLVRFAFGTAWVAAASQIGVSLRPELLAWVVPVAWALANTVAYAALACLDAVLLLEVRIRTEGLDIEIGQARARGEDGSAVLVDAA